MRFRVSWFNGLFLRARSLPVFEKNTIIRAAEEIRALIQFIYDNVYYMYICLFLIYVLLWLQLFAKIRYIKQNIC